MTTEYPIHDESLDANAPMAVDVAQALVLNCCHIHQDRLQPVICHVPYETGGHSKWYITHDPAPADWDSSCKVRSWVHLLSPHANSICWYYFIKNNANADAAIRIQYTLGSLPIHSSIKGPTVAWGADTFRDEVKHQPLTKIRQANTSGFVYVTFTIYAKCDLEIMSICGFEERV